MPEFQKRQRIVIAGGSGLIGAACKTYFLKEGYDVSILTRNMTAHSGDVQWKPDKEWIARDIIDGAHTVLNLCGSSLSDKRWTKRYKAELYQSRIVPAKFLQKLIGSARNPPACYIGASGIGIYGDQGNHVIHDNSPLRAQTFAAKLVEAWEQEHLSIPYARKVILRTGVVISAKGGFLKEFILPMRFGVFPFFGEGKQLLSWISLEDLTRMIHHCLINDSLSGILHATSPQGTPLRAVIKALKEVSRRPGVLLRVPQLFVSVGLGEMSSLLFESADVRPDTMLQSGFRFSHPDIRSALTATMEDVTFDEGV